MRLISGILTPLQDRVLRTFFAEAGVADQFYLTGGTALAAFYFGHRKSLDLDLFTQAQFDVFAVRLVFGALAKGLGGSLEHRVSSATYHEFYIHHGEEALKIDVVQDVDVYFGKVEKVGSVRVDNVENIAVNKVTAIYSRTDVKDFVDLYTILQRTSLVFDALLSQAKRKDVGLNDFYLANMLLEVKRFRKYPKMLVEFDRQEMISFYESLSRKLFQGIRPKR